MRSVSSLRTAANRQRTESARGGWHSAQVGMRGCAAQCQPPRHADRRVEVKCAGILRSRTATADQRVAVFGCGGDGGGRDGRTECQPMGSAPGSLCSSWSPPNRYPAGQSFSAENILPSMGAIPKQSRHTSAEVWCRLTRCVKTSELALARPRPSGHTPWGVLRSVAAASIAARQTLTATPPRAQQSPTLSVPSTPRAPRRPWGGSMG